MFKTAAMAKWSFALAAYIGCVSLFVFLSSRNPLNIVSNQAPVFNLDGCPGGNESGSATYVRQPNIFSANSHLTQKQEEQKCLVKS
jgi:hypothetical protein